MRTLFWILEAFICFISVIIGAIFFYVCSMKEWPEIGVVYVDDDSENGQIMLSIKDKSELLKHDYVRLAIIKRSQK